MNFSSTIFFFAFLPTAIIGYYILPKQCKNIFLIIISLVFYGWGQPGYLVLLGLSVLGNYLFGRLIGAVGAYRIKTKKVILALGTIGNVLVLFYYKYAGFAVKLFNHLSEGNIEWQTVMLPLGISFFTFQGVAYLVDIYRGVTADTKNILRTALYFSFFPKVAQGPIVQYKDFAPQYNKRTESLELFYSGIQRLVIGLAKKLMIANVLGELVDDIWHAQGSYGADMPTLWLGAVCYMLQIYFDFSGYSDMAIGLGRMFGFKFKENFNYPYISKSITEFWRRWHISLSTWFREYLYIPLGGNRKGNVYLNLMIVFLVTGIWHGAAVNFIIWGVYHGIFIITERMIRDKDWYKKIPGIIKLTVTNFIVLIGWVLFRAKDMASAVGYLKAMFGIAKVTQLNYTFAYYLDWKVLTVLVAGIILCTPVAKWIQNKVGNNLKIETVKMIMITILFIADIMLVVSGGYSPFLYFQF